MDSRLMTYAYIARVKSRAIGLAVECDRLADQVWTGEDETYLRLRADIAAGKVEIERDSLEVARGVVPKTEPPEEPAVAVPPTPLATVRARPPAIPWFVRVAGWLRLLRWLL